MKKRVLAVVLAATMVTGTCMTAWADNHEGYAHGSKDQAVVSSDKDGVDTMDTTDPTGKTEFYMVIDKDATSGKEIEIPSINDVESKATEICHYEINRTTKKLTTLSVTVPLYVCMYGYGGDGKVVTPEDGTYQMINDSYYQDSTKVESIAACYQVTVIQSYEEYIASEDGKKAIETYISDTKTAKYDEIEKQYASDTAKIPQAKADADEVIVAEAPEKVYDNYIKNINSTITEAVRSGQYGYYTDKDTKDNIIVKLSECDQHTQNSTCKHKDEDAYKYFFRVNVDSTDEDTPTTVDTENPKLDRHDLPVNIPTIKVESYTWKLKPTNDLNNLKAGEIAMSINNLDLSAVEKEADRTLDIKDLNWYIDGASSSEYTLSVRAAIAGGSVNNDEDCVPVVRVTYTVAPAYERISSTSSAQ